MTQPWQLTDTACDQSTSYNMSNKIVRRDDGLYVTWIDTEYLNWIARVDPSDGSVLSRIVSAQGQDNHCGAALALTPDDTLHVMNGSHSRGFIYMCSSDPTRADSWSYPQVAGGRCTYPSLVSDFEGRLHLAFRHTAWGGGRCCVGYSRKEIGEPWR